MYGFLVSRLLLEGSVVSELKSVLKPNLLKLSPAIITQVRGCTHVTYNIIYTSYLLLIITIPYCYNDYNLIFLI